MTVDRKAALLVVGGLLLAGTAMAKPPNQANSTKPAHVIAVGYKNPPTPSGPDAYGMVTYVMRDDLNNPLPAVRVELRFGGCTDVLVSKVATEMQGNVTVDCATNAVLGTTNGFGELTFAVVARGNGSGPPRLTNDCVQVLVNGAPWSDISVATADRDGAGGLGAADFGFVISDFVLNPTARRSDLNDDGVVGAPDFGILTAIFALGGSALSGAAPCP